MPLQDCVPKFGKLNTAYGRGYVCQAKVEPNAYVEVSVFLSVGAEEFEFRGKDGVGGRQYAPFA